MKTTEILDNIKSRLPHTTQRIIGALGWEGALHFLKSHGNRRVYFPQKYSENHGLFSGMNAGQADAILEEFRGQDVQLPSHKKMLASERYQAIANDYQTRQFSEEMLVDKYKIPRRTVNWILALFES